MNPKTAECFAEIKSAIAAGQTTLVPAMFSHFYGRAACSAAFRMAKSQGLIEVNYICCSGTPVYQGAGIKKAIEDAIEDAKTATMN